MWSWLTFTQSRGFGNNKEGTRTALARRAITDKISTNIVKLLPPQKLALLDQGLMQFENRDGDANRALEAGLKMVHATPRETLPGGLLPKSWSMEDGLCPEKAVLTCWCSSSIRRAIEHTLDNHGSAVCEQGMRIILFGAGAHDNLHTKMIARSCHTKGSSIGSDYYTTMPLPNLNPQQAWNFGPDTMIIDVKSPKSQTPWHTTLLHNSLLSGTRAANALATCNALYNAQPRGCGDCYWQEDGCHRCNKRGMATRLVDIATPLHEHGSHPIVGKRFKRKFDDGEWYEGTVAYWKRGLYRLEYLDGDAEDVDHNFVIRSKKFKLLE